MTYFTMKIIDGIPDKIAEANCTKNWQVQQIDFLYLKPDTKGYIDNL